MGLENFGTTPEPKDTEWDQRVKILNALRAIVNAGTGGGGDATAANQATQITAEQAIQSSTATTATNTGTTATNTGATASGVGATSDAASTAGGTGSLSAKLRLITTQLDAIQTAVQGNSVSESYVFTRPNNSTAYAVKDAVTDSTSAATLLSWSTAAKASGGSGTIIKAVLSTNHITVLPRLRLHLFNTDVGAQLDNTAFNMLASWMATENYYLGYIDFPALSTESTGGSDMAFAMVNSFTLNYQTVAGTTIYGALVTMDAFTPAAQQKFRVTLGFERY